MNRVVLIGILWLLCSCQKDNGSQNSPSSSHESAQQGPNLGVSMTVNLELSGPGTSSANLKPQNISVTLTPTGPGTVITFNALKLCGVSDWAVNVSHTVLGNSSCLDFLKTLF